MATQDPNAPFVEKLSGDDMTKFMRSQQNQMATGGYGDTGQGRDVYSGGLQAFGPVLSQLTSLVKGDQADVSQQMQPEANRIRDSFAAARNIIGQQGRGGGKTTALAEAPFQQARQMGDMAQQARAGASGQLGNVAQVLAGLGLNEQSLGIGETQGASAANLQRRQLDMTAGSFANQFNEVMQGIGAVSQGMFKPR